MTDNALSRLLAVKTNADKLTTDRKNYADYVADRVFHGWEVCDVAEYKAEVMRIMIAGTDAEKQAASEFWAMKARERYMSATAEGINDRIRASIVAASSTC